MEVGRGHRQAPFVTRGTARRSGKVVVDPEEIRRELKREGELTTSLKPIPCARRSAIST